jgi:NitT/TauT family transport system ATP-binding protein
MVLEFKSVTKRFLSKENVSLTAVSDVNFGVKKGEFVSVVGPSGCGKSTILSMTAGLYQPSEGEVLVSGEPVTGPNAHVGFMLQKDLLLPWRSILSNIEFGLEARGVSKSARRERAHQELQRCHLAGFEGHYPYQLSGGMRQRAALARTLAIDPEIILLDEPFSALDAQTKLQLEDVLLDLWSEEKRTVVFITHDLNEAVTLSDRVIVMSARPGRILADIPIPLERPRSVRALQKNPRYHQLYAEVWSWLEQGLAEGGLT